MIKEPHAWMVMARINNIQRKHQIKAGLYLFQAIFINGDNGLELPKCKASKRLHQTKLLPLWLKL